MSAPPQEELAFKAVEDAYGVSKAIVRRKSRKVEHVHARATVAWLLRHRLQYSLVSIGEVINNHYSNVIHLLKVHDGQPARKHLTDMANEANTLFMLYNLTGSGAPLDAVRMRLAKGIATRVWQLHERGDLTKDYLLHELELELSQSNLLTLLPSAEAGGYGDSGPHF